MHFKIRSKALFDSLDLTPFFDLFSFERYEMIRILRWWFRCGMEKKLEEENSDFHSETLIRAVLSAQIIETKVSLLLERHQVKREK